MEQACRPLRLRGTTWRRGRLGSSRPAFRSRLPEILAAGSDLTGRDRGGLRWTAFCFHLFTVVHVFVVGVDRSDGGGKKKKKNLQVCHGGFSRRQLCKSRHTNKQPTKMSLRFSRDHSDVFRLLVSCLTLQCSVSKEVSQQQRYI